MNTRETIVTELERQDSTGDLYVSQKQGLKWLYVDGSINIDDLVAAIDAAVVKAPVEPPQVIRRLREIQQYHDCTLRERIGWLIDELELTPAQRDAMGAAISDAEGADPVDPRS